MLYLQYTRTSNLKLNTSSNILECIYLLLKEFKCRKEDCVYNAGPTYRNPNASIHPPVKELDLGCWLGLSHLMCEAVPLVNGLGGIDGVDKNPTQSSTEAAGGYNSQGRRRC